MSKIFDYLLTGDHRLMPNAGASSPVADGAIGALTGLVLGVALCHSGFFDQQPGQTAQPEPQSRNPYRNATVADAEDELLRQPRSPAREKALQFLANYPPTALLSSLPPLLPGS